MDSIDAIILAGGLGTRLRPVLNDRPKVLAPVNGRPFLDYLLAYLNTYNCIQRIVIAVAYKAQMIIDYCQYARHYHFEIGFSLEKKLLGTGGAMKKALGETTAPTVLALNGDSFIAVDIDNFLQYHKEKKALLSIVSTYQKDCLRFGFINMRKDNRIISFNEKTDEQQEGYINAGVYLFQRNIFSSFADNTVFSFENDVIPRFLAQGLFGYVSTKEFIDIGVPETYAKAEDFFEFRPA